MRRTNVTLRLTAEVSKVALDAPPKMAPFQTPVTLVTILRVKLGGIFHLNGKQESLLEAISTPRIQIRCREETPKAPKAKKKKRSEEEQAFVAAEESADSYEENHWTDDED